MNIIATTEFGKTEQVPLEISNMGGFHVSPSFLATTCPRADLFVIVVCTTSKDCFNFMDILKKEIDKPGRTTRPVALVGVKKKNKPVQVTAEEITVQSGKLRAEYFPVAGKRELQLPFFHLAEKYLEMNQGGLR
jgi:hypothetical protein